MKYDVIIIGGGASGLYAALQLRGRRVLLIEKKQRLGMKMMVSGSGKCNLTHSGSIRDFYEHYGAQTRFVKQALAQHNNIAVQVFFQSLGIQLVHREDGKVFPECESAKAVVAAMETALENDAGMNLIRGVSALKCLETNHGFDVITEEGTYSGKALILATGGRSYPALGADGDGYGLAASFGHRISATHPGLAAVFLKEQKLCALQGLVFENASLQHMRAGRMGKIYSGALLITHFGLSGPVILDNSRDFLPGDQLMIDFLGKGFDYAEQCFSALAQKEGRALIGRFFNVMGVPETLKKHLLSICSSECGETRLSEMSREMRVQVNTYLTRYPVTIESVAGYERAMVTVGGVSTEEIDRRTMASKCVPGLYVIGELLDVDGDSGGYNLQWAFSSAYVAAQSILKRLI